LQFERQRNVQHIEAPAAESFRVALGKAPRAQQCFISIGGGIDQPTAPQQPIDPCQGRVTLTRDRGALRGTAPEMKRTLTNRIGDLQRVQRQEEQTREIQSPKFRHCFLGARLGSDQFDNKTCVGVNFHGRD
jgi:hypothetical protein